MLAEAVRQQTLYRDIWAQDPNYGTRQNDVRDTLLHRIGPHMRKLGLLQGFDSTMIDFGAGDGRFLREAYDLGFISNGIGVDVYLPDYLPKWLSWRPCAAWDAYGETATYAISTDALEHMPPAMVPSVLARIAESAPHGFLRISTKQDIYGTERGLHLHETVEPPEWWLARLDAVGIKPSSWRVYPGHAVEVWY